MSSKEKILALLEIARGKSISGQHIAKELNLSRNAVWKSIKELEKDGYKIDAVRNKGYCLCEDNDILSVQGILPFLKDNDHGSNIIIYDNLQSTNYTAKELALKDNSHGSIILANSQTQGKGRYGRDFYSPAGYGIYMSIILNSSQFTLNPPTLITAFAALCVCEAIETLTKKNPSIKWVNDIYLDKKKICGILTEAITSFETGNIEWIVVGIGINFSTPANIFPDNLNEIAGSIFSDQHPNITRNRLIAEIANRIFDLDYHNNKNGLLAEYKRRLMMLGEKITIIEQKRNYEVTAMDIDSNGALIVKDNSGELKTLCSGEISIKL